MKDIETITKILLANKKQLQIDYNVEEIGVFGSYVREEQCYSSDIDILVTFSKPIGMFKFLELEEYLSSLLGLQVDLVSKKALKPKIGQHILEEVLII